MPATFCVFSERGAAFRTGTVAVKGSTKQSALPSRPPLAQAARSAWAMLDNRRALYRRAMNSAAVSLPAVPVRAPVEQVAGRYEMSARIWSAAETVAGGLALTGKGVAAGGQQDGGGEQGGRAGD